MKHVERGNKSKTLFKVKTLFVLQNPLNYFHMDLFGPSRTMSLGGNYYDLLIVDEYSRFTWTLFLRTKNDAFDAFCKLAKVIQNEKGLNIVSIRSDHGGEFQNEDFEKFCEENGIHHNFSQEHLKKIVLWRGKIGLLKKELELF